MRNQREVINTAVKADVASIFKGKTHSQLLAMQKQITNKISAGGPIDIGLFVCLFVYSLFTIGVSCLFLVGIIMTIYYQAH